MKFIQQVSQASVGCILLLVTAGCDSDNTQNMENTQVAAKVNETEITVHQVNAELASLARQNPSTFDPVKETPSVLEKTINQELFIQRAENLELNRRPEVLQALERAKRQVLAQAYVEHLFNTLPEPTESEILKYYEETPALFSARKYYQLQQIVFDPAADINIIRKRLSSANSLEEISNWVKEENIRVSTRIIKGAAEQIPLNILPMIYGLEDNKGVMPADMSPPTLFWQMSSKDAPLSLEEASPFIKKYLVTTARTEKINQETRRLRETAMIEYKGQFGKSKPRAVTPTEAPETNISDASAIKKGLEGL